MALTFNLVINCENAAFDEVHVGHEVARILREAAETVEGYGDFGRIRDANGNRVGFWTFEEV